MENYSELLPQLRSHRFEHFLAILSQKQINRIGCNKKIQIHKALHCTTKKTLTTFWKLNNNHFNVSNTFFDGWTFLIALLPNRTCYYCGVAKSGYIPEFSRIPTELDLIDLKNWRTHYFSNLKHTIFFKLLYTFTVLPHLIFVVDFQIKSKIDGTGSI